MEVEFYLIEHVRFSCGSNLNRIVALLNSCNMNFQLVLKSPLKYFSNRTVKSCPTILLWITLKICDVFIIDYLKSQYAIIFSKTKSLTSFIGKHMNVFFFTFVFECYQESVVSLYFYWFLVISMIDLAFRFLTKIANCRSKLCNLNLEGQRFRIVVSIKFV